MLEIAMCNLHIMNLNLERAILMIATLSNSVEMKERESEQTKNNQTTKNWHRTQGKTIES